MAAAHAAADVGGVDLDGVGVVASAAGDVVVRYVRGHARDAVPIPCCHWQ